MSEQKLDLILKVFGEIRDKMNEFGAETNLKDEFREFRININRLENKIMLEQAEKFENKSEKLKQEVVVRELQERVRNIEINLKLAA